MSCIYAFFIYHFAPLSELSQLYTECGDILRMLARKGDFTVFF